MKNTALLTLAALFMLAASPCAHAVVIHYTYDGAGRLTNAAYAGGANIAYVYDANGNLLQRTTTPGGAVTYTLIYRAGAGGWIGGMATQEVAAGANGSAVTAVVENASAVFHAWSDGRADNPRADTNVQANLTVQAAFRSAGGADLDWYAARGIAPGGGEDWSDVDARAVPAKGTTLLHENIADTDPNNTNDVFHVTDLTRNSPVTVHFDSSTGRVYTLEGAGNLVDGPWMDIPGGGPRSGAGGADSAQDTNEPPRGPFYRMGVGLP